MKFLHTSDWHLGRLFHQRSLIEDQIHIIEQIIALALEHAVDAVLIAGDIYDRAVPPAEAVRLFDRTVTRLCVEHGIPVIAIAGNHDSGDRVGFGEHLLKDGGFRVSGTPTPDIEPTTVTVGDLSIDVFPLPFATPAEIRSAFAAEASTYQDVLQLQLAAVDAKRVAGRPTVVMAHCFVAGSSISESERDLAVGGAERVGADLFAPYDYVALGHLHGPQRCGVEHVRYSGTPLKYSFSEISHNKSVTIVEFDSAGVTGMRDIPLAPLRDVRVIRGALSDLLREGGEDPRSDDYVQVQLTDSDSQLDAMARIRTVYPNALQLLYERRATPAAANAADLRERLSTGHREMFCSFFEAVQGVPLSAAQQAHLSTVIERAQSRDADEA